MPRLLDIDGFTWKIVALPREAERQADDDWHYARVRFEPQGNSVRRVRETWLRLEEDVPANDVLDQYADEYLIEAFLVAEAVNGVDE